MRLLTAAAAAILLVLPVSADVVHLKNGGRLEGATSRDGDRLVIRLESGTVRIPMRDVRRIVAATPKVDEYAKLAAAERAHEERVARAEAAERARAARVVERYRYVDTYGYRYGNRRGYRYYDHHHDRRPSRFERNLLRRIPSGWRGPGWNGPVPLVPVFDR